MPKIIEPKGFLIGDMARIRVVLEDGRRVDRQIPLDKLHLTLASIFETGLPTKDEENFPGVETWIPPTKIRSIVVCKDDKAFSLYDGAASITRESIERGFITNREAKVTRNA